MATVAGVLLMVLLIIMFQQYRNGTLGMWLRAKFLNQKPTAAP